MARTINFNFSKGGGSDLEFMVGTISLEPTMIHDVGSRRILPTPTIVGVSNGLATMPNIEPSPEGIRPDWAYKVIAETMDPLGNPRKWSWLVTVPEGTSALNFTSLPQLVSVNPPDWLQEVILSWVDASQAQQAAIEAAASALAAETSASGAVSAVAALDTKTTNRDDTLQESIDSNTANLRGEVLGAYAATADAENMGLRPANSTTYAIPFTDRDGAVAAGVLTDGTFNFEKPLEVMGAGGVAFQPVTAPGWAELHPDKDGYISYGVRDDGTFVVFKPAPEISYDPLRAANDTLGYTKTARDKICTIGDSLTEGYFGGVGGQAADAWPTKLKNLLGAGVAVTNLAVSGYAVDEEAIRVGALQVPLTVTGGQIPASGTVEVTTTTVIGWVPSAARNFTGTLAGVPGTLRRTSASNTVFEFIRTTDGAAVTVPPGTKFVSNAAGRDAQILIILLGRNDVSNNIKGAEATVAEHIIKGVERIVNWQSRQIKKVLVVSVTNGQNEPSGHANYKTIATANAGLMSLMGNRFLDFRSHLVNDAIHAAGITPTGADLTAMAVDAPPPSVMNDNIHWSKQTHIYFAGLVHDYLITRDWTAS